LIRPWSLKASPAFSRRPYRSGPDYAEPAGALGVVLPLLQAGPGVLPDRRAGAAAGGVAPAGSGEMARPFARRFR
jgi:hypothetical protein